MNFQPWNSNTNPLFRKIYVLKFKDKINLKNILFISKSVNNLLPSLFNNWFAFSSDTHKYNTSWSSNDKPQKYSYRTNTFGKNSIIISAIETWNNSQDNLKRLQDFWHLTKLSYSFLMNIWKTTEQGYDILYLSSF